MSRCLSLYEASALRPRVLGRLVGLAVVGLGLGAGVVWLLFAL